jgi:glyceraldehyde 3-phosphate dehydrogenase
MRIAINGFGRIGRAAFKVILETPALEPVAVNDLAPLANLAYLLKYDTVYGRYERRVDRNDKHLIVDGMPYRVFAQKDPARSPWAELGVDLVLECTGAFRRKEDLEQHIRAGRPTWCPRPRGRPSPRSRRCPSTRESRSIRADLHRFPPAEHQPQ